MNGAARNDTTELGKLMHDFFCTDPDDMHYRELAEKARYFKQDEKGVATMCKAMEDMRKDAVWHEKVDTVIEFAKMGLPHEQIAQGTRLSVEQVKEIIEERRA